MESLGDILRRLTERNTFASREDAPVLENQDEEARCPACDGKRWVRFDVPVGHPNFGKVTLCRCQEERFRGERTARLRRYSNLDELPRFTFDSLSPQGRSEILEDQRLFRQAYEAAQDFAAEPKGWLVFSGPMGCGKTHLAAAMGHQLLQEGRSVFYVFVPDLLDHLRSTFGPSSEISYDDLFEQVRNSAILILDDLGMQSATPWAEEKLYQILNHRFNSEMPTVITVDKALSELDEPMRRRISDGNLSRVYELERRTASIYSRLGSVEPELLERMRFDNFDVRGNNADAGGRDTLEGALQVAKNFARDPHGWITFTGKTGCGKTHLAVAMTNEWLKAGQPVVFTFVPSLLDHLRFTFSPESRITYDELFEQIKAAPLLILDDLGSESTTPWAEEKLYQIIVHRHNGRLPTVITSREDSFENTPLAKPIVSRLKDPTVGGLVRITAPDYRDRERRKESTGTRTPRARRAG